MKRLIGLGLALLVVVACGSQVVLFPSDAGVADTSVSDANETSMMETSVPDVSVESSLEAGIETGVETGMEASLETSLETGLEASLEAGIDSPMETGCIPGTVLPVDLGTSGGFAILAESGISTVPVSAITGNIGVSPIAASAITGFALTPCTGTCAFSTSTQVVGQVFAANYGVPAPANMTTAVSNMQTAYTDAAGRPPGVTELGSGNISGMTLAPGVYKWSTGLLIATNVTLKGGCGDVWIFEVADGLTMNSGAQVLLSGGALAKNIFWQVAGGLSGVSVSLGTTAHIEGTVLALDAITLGTTASVNGRLLSQKAVTLEQNAVTIP